MTIESELEYPSPVRVIDALVARHGLVRVALALAAFPLRSGSRVRRAYVDDLPDRLRRDIGLEPRPESRRHWDVRL